MGMHLVTTAAELEALFLPSLRLADCRLGDVLVEQLEMIDRQQLELALLRQQQQPGTRLGQLLVEMECLDSEQLILALALHLGIPHIGLEHYSVPASVLGRLSAEAAFRYQAMPLAETRQGLIIALVDPLSVDVLEMIRFQVSLPLLPVIASQRDILLALSKYYSQFDEDQALAESRLRSQGASLATDYGDPVQFIELEARKRPIVRLLNTIVVHALVAGASDINIRPEAEAISVYYRVDGHLYFSRAFDKTLLAALVSRVKILGGMNIAERRLPQEGNARLVRGQQRVDLRLSILPTVTGESVVIRILDEAVGLRPLADIGLPTEILAGLRAFLRRPYGLLLVTGPTGSGKSTTLYALLNELRAQNPHILTIEDPVEYHMEGIEQIQVQEQIGISFASTLRRFMRHDPDVMMIGEIRDRETAEIAIQAALTGHLVVSTLHTNDAPGAVTRLVEMGVEPYLLAATLLGVLAQRLVRLNCKQCAEKRVLSAHRRSALPSELAFALEQVDVFQGAGCSHCRQSGYAGRELVCELMSVDRHLSAAIARAAERKEMLTLARAKGWRPLAEHALEKVRRGQTTPEEVVQLFVEG